jgi:adenylate kinase
MLVDGVGQNTSQFAEVPSGESFEPTSITLQLDRLNSSNVEHHALHIQQLHTAFYETAGDPEAIDQLFARVSEQERDVLWRLRISVATGKLATDSSETDSSDWLADKLKELNKWKSTEAHPLAAEVKESVRILDQDTREWARAKRDLMAKIGLLVVYGLPGAGKGTQAPFYEKFLHCIHISTGDILRTRATDDQRERMAEGELLSAAEVSGIVSQIFKLVDPNMCLLDGYPRSAEQVKHLLAGLDEATIAKMMVLYLKLDDAEAKDRLLERAEKEGRADDTEVAITKRIKTFHQITEPALETFRSHGVRIVTVDAGKPIMEVYQNSIHQLLQPTPAPLPPLRTAAYLEESQAAMPRHQGRLRALLKNWRDSRNRSTEAVAA